MTQKFTLLLSSLILLVFGVSAQSTYNITSNSNWSATLPSTCYSCTINISSNVTLTIDNSPVCQNCTFSGGNISMTNQSLNLQYANSQATTNFKNVNFVIYGKNSSVIVNAPLSLLNSIFTFYSKSYIQTSYDVTLDGSIINLYDTTNMQATGGSNTSIILIDASKINVGNGSQTSASYLFMNGPTLYVYDKSGVVLGNNNNDYYNWSNYSGSNAKSTNANTKSYSTSNNNLNCGGANQHSCSNPYLYGPATLTSSGAVSGATLPVVLVSFTATMGNQSVALNWETKIEENSSRFAIERSADGSVWEEIGSVAAKGNSSLATDYSFTDGNPLTGTNFYRIKMIDLDGRYGYTEVRVVRTAAISNISFFPNPAHDYVNVSLTSGATVETTIRLINQSGQVMQEKKVENGNGTIVTFPLQQVASGMYIISVASTDGSHQSSKIFVSK